MNVLSKKMLGHTIWCNYFGYKNNPTGSFYQEKEDFENAGSIFLSLFDESQPSNSNREGIVRTELTGYFIRYIFL